MAANDLQLSRVPIQNGEVSVQNTDGTNDFTPGMCVTFDSTNGIPGATQYAIGVKQSTTDDYIFGVCLENILHNVSAANKGAVGRVLVPYASIGRVVAGATNAGVIAAGSIIEADTAGQVKVAAAAKPQIGQALTAAAAQGDQVLAALSFAKNA